MKDNFKETLEISLLYKISLAVGASLDARDNCRHFLDVLTSQKSLTSASVWRCDLGESSGEYKLFFVHPNLPAGRQALPQDHFILKELESRPYFSMAASDAGFPEISPEESAETGAFAVFRLGESGLLAMYDATRREVFSNLEMEQLQGVAEKFSISLEGSIAHEKITEEPENRSTIQQALFKANRTAEQARLSERQFLANMSHEIRTPMNAVIGMTHLLYETNPTQTQKVYLESLRFAADSLMGIIDNVLDLSKIEAGELEFEEKSFNLQQLMKSLQRSFQFKMRDKAISIDISYDPAIEYQVIGDSTRLNQILTNLLGNSSKFTEKGWINFSSKLLQNTEDKYWIEFRVEDTGIGIPEDKLEDIFKNFKQANVKIARKYGGSGLGLTIVKQLVELQGGSIQVVSQLEKGSAFIFTLPFKKSDVKISEKQQEYRIGQSSSRSFLKTLFVLVVEDNLMNQKLITKILDIWKCDYLVANDGLEALDVSQQEVFDLILMDIHMPEMDGCEATEKIRKDPANPNQKTPIIALTAAAMLEEKKRAVKAGMSDFLTKPFSPEMLEACILQHLNFKEEEHDENEDEAEHNCSSRLHVNLDYLFEFSNNDRLFVLDIIDTFLLEAPAKSEHLEQALRDDDWKNVYKIVHNLKPNFMMLGMTEQHEKAIQIENLISRDNFDKQEASELISRLAACARLACPVLEAMKPQV